jgi:hypothetical protein
VLSNLEHRGYFFLFSSDTKDDLTGQSSGNSTGYCKQLTCMDVNTEILILMMYYYKSKLNIDGLKTCDGRSSLKLKVVSSGHVAFRTESVLLYDWNSLLTVL